MMAVIHSVWYMFHNYNESQSKWPLWKAAHLPPTSPVWESKGYQWFKTPTALSTHLWTAMHFIQNAPRAVLIFGIPAVRNLQRETCCCTNVSLYWLLISFLFFIFLHAFFKSSTNLTMIYCNLLRPNPLLPPTSTSSCDSVQSKCTMNPLCPPMTTGLVNLSGCSSN